MAVDGRYKQEPTGATSQILAGIVLAKRYGEMNADPARGSYGKRSLARNTKSPP